MSTIVWRTIDGIHVGRGGDLAGHQDQAGLQGLADASVRVLTALEHRVRDLVGHLVRVTSVTDSEVNRYRFATSMPPGAEGRRLRLRGHLNWEG